MTAPVRYLKLANDLASMLDVVLNGCAENESRAKKMGFILTVFPFGHRQPGAMCVTTSNAHPFDVAEILDQQAETVCADVKRQITDERTIE